ncbi:ROK family protein [Nocardia colli]|uniref:ROK family protein n=1 Tax=Nocardia colli TaxID=2545717 RepID=A0A5N0DZS4_9NOCA|nr:ROK family protein [Nocardia colli]KAA8881890.1 ROK family protein [Nocardia colli]
MTVLAFEINGSGFAAGLVGAEDIQRLPAAAGDPWARCRELLLEVAGGIEITAVGIACQGPIDMGAGIIAPADIREWRAGFDVAAAVRDLFPAASVHVALDGVCLALAERNFGGTNDTVDALSINVSDRVSGGIMTGGLIVAGRTGNAGHIGHVLVPGFDETCVCGGHGCLDAVAGGRSAVNWARERGWSGESGQALVEAARLGEPIPIAALGRAGTALGRAIASVAALLDIDLVIVGGTLAQAGPELWKPLGAEISAHARMAFLPGLRVVPSGLAELGVLAGAGLLAMMGTGQTE